MTIYRVFGLWLLIILLGSILTQLVYFPVALLFDNKDFKFIAENFVFWTFFAVLYSGLFSIPGQLVLFVSNEFLKKSKAEAKTFKLIFMTIYFIAILISFGLLSYASIHDEFNYMLTCFLVYTTTGAIIWNKGLMKNEAV